VIEVGQGSGRNTRALLEAGLQVTPVADSAPYTQLPDARDTYAAALASHAYLHGTTEKLRAGMAELRRVLRPGASVRLVEHVRAPQASVAAIQEALTRLQRRLAGNCQLDRRAEDALRAAGFTIERCRPHLGGSLLELTARAPS